MKLTKAQRQFIRDCARAHDGIPPEALLELRAISGTPR